MSHSHRYYELNNIDWGLLRFQKRLLLAVQACTTSEQEKAALEGILELFDCIQDQAVSMHGLSEEVVFDPFTEEEAAPRAAEPGPYRRIRRCPDKE